MDTLTVLAMVEVLRTALAYFIALVLSLAGVRIVAVRYSPRKVREEL